jgi:hypothetical protein
VKAVNYIDRLIGQRIRNGQDTRTLTVDRTLFEEFKAEMQTGYFGHFTATKNYVQVFTPTGVCQIETEEEGAAREARLSARQ